MEALRAPLLANQQFQEIEKQMEQQAFPIMITGSENTQRCFLMDFFGRKYKNRLIITYNEQQAKKIYDEYRFFDRDIYIYPAKDVLFYSADIHGNAIVRRRLEILRRIIEEKPTTIVLTIDALLDRLPKLSEIKKNCCVVEGASELSVEKFTKKLVALGYEKTEWVDGAGQFAVRGGIIDIYPLTEECPYRIELWGDEIDSIRSFDVESQRSIEQVDRLVIYPATEMVLSQKRMDEGLEKIEKEHKEYAQKLKKEFKTEAYARINKAIAGLKEELQEFHAAMGIDSYISYFYDELVSFLDYFESDTIIYLDEPGRVLERGAACQLEFRESMISRLEGGYILPSQANVLFDYKEILARTLNKKTMLFATLIQQFEALPVRTSFDIDSKPVESYNNHFDFLLKDMEKWRKEDYRIVLISPSATRGKRLCENIENEGLICFYSEDKKRILQPKEIMVTTGRLGGGFRMPDCKLVVISENDIFHFREQQKRKKRKSVYSGEKIQNFADISVGDYVVHERHGLGIYQGIEKIEVDKVIKDYISIEYAGGSKLFILASQLDMIQKYASQEAKKPKLNKLGGNEWEKTKSKVRGQVKEIAKELVELYAVRQSKEGFAFSKDTVWQKEFEELFPYEETEDQLQAIAETKKDMESKKIMDRLICGDVGYGKTEVAIRAAFKAVGDGKQVVYLVPTTILAQQHYNSFKERMKDFPIQIRMLSRFCTAKEQKETIQGLKKGQVDIVIGTHRLLSKDIEYKSLGLLIVDEEQRFGVTHKEKIKQLKKDIDVLTLSATPIPRTLHMSLIGIRDMSLLEEPPVDRRAIQTYVLEYNMELVREAILREMARGGQVYYVYNRVNNIEEIAYQVSQLVPQARVAFAHGQMKERELEDIMYQFINKEIDVLVTTTIIETGLDIANANTMIIHDAENFGLSQLYQLRGRVGRSNRNAYAFLMYRRDKMLKETAEKRLQAIREFTDLGSGFKIAMRDLEIRGAGNLLGQDQSGHMAAVGYDLYCKMLNDEVRRQKGEITEEETFETTVEFPMDAYIPATYVKNEFMKLELYKKIAQIENQEDYEDMVDEMTDRFGNMPTAALNLLAISLLKAKAHRAAITEITIQNEQLQILMYPGAKVMTEKIDALLQKYKRTMRFITNPAPGFRILLKNVAKKEYISFAEEMVNEIQLLLE